MMEEECLSLILKNNYTKNIPIDTELLNDCKDKQITQSLIRKHHYYVQLDVNEEIFNQFIDYWATKKVPNITSANYYDFYLLNQEFKIKFIDDFLKEKEDIFNEYEKNFLKLKDKTINDKFAIEQLISAKIDIYLNMYQNDLMSLPIQQLNRIFSNSKLDLKNHILAYQAIINQYQKSNNLDIFTLLPFLDGNKLSKDIVTECLQKKDERLQFLPNFNYQSFEAKIAEKDAKISELENQLESFQLKMNNLFNLFLDNQYITNLSHFYLSNNLNWNQVNINEFTFSEGPTNYTLKSSSTWNNSGDYVVTNLLDENKEKNWVSNYGDTAFIIISSQNSPFCANLISLTARYESNSREAPSIFDVLAKNEDENEFVLLKSFTVFSWKPYERKIFTFDNSKSYSSYKLSFNYCAFKDSNGRCYGLSEFNIGNAHL